MPDLQCLEEQRKKKGIINSRRVKTLEYKMKEYIHTFNPGQPYLCCFQAIRAETAEEARKKMTEYHGTAWGKTIPRRRG